MIDVRIINMTSVLGPTRQDVFDSWGTIAIDLIIGFKAGQICRGTLESIATI
jgi:hypothetical protein